MRDFKFFHKFLGTQGGKNGVDRGETINLQPIFLSQQNPLYRRIQWCREFGYDHTMTICFLQHMNDTFWGISRRDWKRLQKQS